MKIDLKEFNVILKDFLHQYGIEHFSSVVSYTSDRVKMIMVIPGRNDETESICENLRVSTGQGVAPESDERLSV